MLLKVLLWMNMSLGLMQALEPQHVNQLKMLNWTLISDGNNPITVRSLYRLCHNRYLGRYILRENNFYDNESALCNLSDDCDDDFNLKFAILLNREGAT